MSDSQGGSQANALRHALRSIGAVVAGIALGVLLSLGTDMLLFAAGIFPAFGERVPDRLLAIATAYRAVYSVAGAYLTARLAPSRPMLHALILGVLGLVVAAIGAVATWNAGPAFEPKWYPLALVAIAVPTAWVGAVLYDVSTSPRVGG